MGRDQLLSVTGLAKRYGATVALQSLSMEVAPREVHAILGENGAGKSTLVKILSGVVRPNGGTMRLGGSDYTPHSIVEARRAGVSTAFQELSLLPNLTVAENLLLPNVSGGPLRPSSRGDAIAAARDIFAEFDIDDIDPRWRVEDLSLAEKQRLEITRAFSHKPRLLILDEPTAALPDTTWLFDQIRRLTGDGVAILYISHRLAEVRELCQRATVLRNGVSIGTVDLAGINDDEIFKMMVGRAPEARFPGRAPAAGDRPVVLEGRNLSSGRMRDVSFELRQGEILGVAALEGQGQLELFRALAGLAPATGGDIQVDGSPAALASPHQAMAAGIAYVPEERKVEGVFGGLTAAANVSLPKIGAISRSGILTHAQDAKAIAGPARAVELADRYFGFRMNDLSGGNQQKAVLARALMSGARCLVMFDPTRGVDVGTKQAIYAMMRDFADKGGAILVYSSELPELVNLCDACLVIYGGRVAAEVPRGELSEQYLLTAAHGHVGDEPMKAAS
ncbi:sugar ABC transporter ATP-binding protein [Microbaculum marinum]|uniref:Sugar ABC transporter ATP-binding protein n=1 Tax=Microbaculum marinum TaxID=1764581 RepID=A0AAW9RJL9_9HYPH